jgi:hypothetical protein
VKYSIPLKKSSLKEVTKVFAVLWCFQDKIQIPLKEPTLGSENDGGLALMAVTSNHTIAMKRNFEFRDYHGRYSKDGRNLSVPTIPEIGLCTKVVKLPY